MRSALCPPGGRCSSSCIWAYVLRIRRPLRPNYYTMSTLGPLFDLGLLVLTAASSIRPDQDDADQQSREQHFYLETAIFVGRRCGNNTLS
jgi:hypothetical protein